MEPTLRWMMCLVVCVTAIIAVLGTFISQSLTSYNVDTKTLRLSKCSPEVSPDSGSITPEIITTTEFPSSKVTASFPQHEPDIEETGKWQRAQVELYCQKYKVEQLEFPRDYASQHRRFRYFVFDDNRKLIFAPIPKVSSTTLRCLILFAREGAATTIKSCNSHYLQPATFKASFINPSLTDTQRMEKLKTYFKLTFVRNPLERLVSGYISRILKPPLDYNNTGTLWLKEPILRQYKFGELQRWKESRGSFDLMVTFPEYIRWVVNTKNGALDPHFAPVIEIIQPCRIRFDFYGNFKQLGQDVAKVMEKFHISSNYFRNASYHKAGRETKDYLDEYYGQVDKELKHSLFHDFYQELDFYYHLFPEERTSHMKLLEVDELVV